MNPNKTMILASGKQDGIHWKLEKVIGALTTDFQGNFNTDSCETTRKQKVRNKDRQWFNKHLGKSYMKQFECHHQWGLGERCYILTPEEHKIRDATEAENRNRIR